MKTKADGKDCVKTSNHIKIIAPNMIPEKIKAIEKELIEKLADIEHERWSDWHKYCREKWTSENIARWNKQADTSYAELSEPEKASDRREVMRYWPLIKSSLVALLEADVDEMDKDYNNEEIKLEYGCEFSNGRDSYIAQKIAHRRAAIKSLKE